MTLCKSHPYMAGERIQDAGILIALSCFAMAALPGAPPWLLSAAAASVLVGVVGGLFHHFQPDNGDEDV